MNVDPINSSVSGSSAKKSTAERAGMKAEDFINLMVTQLQNQDPLEPAKNSELLQQMSQIGQLQSSQDLQTSLKTMVLQNNLGSAGNLIGKEVEGLDDFADPVSGVVSSVRVEGGSVYLELENGHKLSLSQVSSINSASASDVGAVAAS